MSDTPIFCLNCGANLLTDRGVLHIQQEQTIRPILVSEPTFFSTDNELTMSFEIYVCADCGKPIEKEQTKTLLKAMKNV